MNDFTIGTCVGLVQTFVGHPLDTIKTNYQNNSKYKIKFNKLYNGLRYPMISTVITNSLLFHFNGNLEKKINNSFVSGFATGIICAPIINSFEVYKVQNQINTPKIMKFNYLTNLGLSATFVRESIGTSLYFGTYNKLREYRISPFLSGGLAGTISWLITYPIDVIKTRIQSKEFSTYLNAIKKGGLTNGLFVCLCRSFLVNSLSFSVYDYLKNNIKSQNVLD